MSFKIILHWNVVYIRLPTLVEFIAQICAGRYTIAFMGNALIGGGSIFMHTYFLIIVKSVYEDMREAENVATASKV